jgi:MFS family permease
MTPSRPTILPGAAMESSLADRWLILMMSSASALCAMMSSISFSPIIGDIARDVGVDLGTASVAFIGASTFAMAAGMAVFGFLVDRVDVFRIVTGSLVALIVSSAAIPVFGHSYWAILMIRVVQGLCSAGLMVSITPSIARWFPHNEIGRAMGFPSVGAGVGMIIGLNAAPLFMRHLGGWRWGIAVQAFVAAGALAFAVFAAMRARPHTPGVQVNTMVLPPQRVNLMHLPIFWIGLGVIALACWANMSFADLTPGFLSVAAPVGVGYGPQKAGGLMSLFAVSGVIGAPLAGLLMDTRFRHENRSVILLGFLLGAGTYTAILLPVVHDHRVLLGAVLLFGGAANPFVNVTLMSIVAKTVPIGVVGRICGLWMSLSFFAGATGVVAGSLALRISGDYRVSLTIIGVTCIAGFLASLMLPQRTPDGQLPLPIGR